MKIRITLPDDLIERAKKSALEAKTTFSEFMENAVRESLARREKERPKREFKLITYGYGGVMRGVNLDDSAALQDLMDPPEELRKKFLG